MIKRKETALRRLDEGNARLGIWDQDLFADEEILKTAVRKKGCDVFPYVNDKTLLTEEVVRIAVEANTRLIYCGMIGKEQMRRYSDEFILYLLEHSETMLAELDLERITPEMIEKASNTDVLLFCSNKDAESVLDQLVYSGRYVRALESKDARRFKTIKIPKHLRKKQHVLAAAAWSGHVEAIPKSLMTKDFIIAHIENGGGFTDVISKKADKVLDEEAAEIIFEHRPCEALKHLPLSLITEEMVETAAREQSSALFCIPDQLKTEEICFIQISKNPWHYDAVPYYLRSHRICELVRQNVSWLNENWYPLFELEENL